MNYNDLALFGFGLGGVLIHNLIKINELNQVGKFSAAKYFGLEWASISISMIILFLCIMGKHEVAQLEGAGTWLGLAFTTIGYMGQSIFVKYMGKASKAIGGDNTPKTDKDNGSTSV